LYDQKEYKSYTPLQQLTDSKRNLQICNSHLSEFAVLGFELGFSYYNPDSLTMWEAQFGDFSNGAQVIIDQFITSGESKWNVQTGLVMLLPHGMDGQGPEHSCARVERFLQNLDDDPRVIPNLDESKKMWIQTSNFQVCNPSFAANYFHLLRRQIKRNFRKPLIVSSPKRLLRLKAASSTIEEFSTPTFMSVRPEMDQNVIDNTKNVKKLLICSGQVYYDLLARRTKLNRTVI